MQAEIIHTEMQYARAKTLERKQDTRRKIQHGGLVKKAGLDHLKTSELYGLLLDAAERLNLDSSGKLLDDWQISGDFALTHEQELSAIKG